MSEISFEELVEEHQFVDILQPHAEEFLRLSNTLLSAGGVIWNKKHYYQLLNETDTFESVLDDFGARYNRTYGYLTEMVASLRWFAHSGYSLTHHMRRLESYDAERCFDEEERAQSRANLDETRVRMRTYATRLLEAIRAEIARLGMDTTSESYPEEKFTPVTARRRLPRNVGQADFIDEEQKIAEVASRYLKAGDVLAEIGAKRIEDPEARSKYLAEHCTEEQARVYEAKVHNLQSMYDTHIANTVLESKDARLHRIRGHASATLHLIEAVTYLTHFVERHEGGGRTGEGKERVGKLICRFEVQDIILNGLLYWANRYMQAGADAAQSLLPSYLKVQNLEVLLPDYVSLHARPVALIVGIVNRYGTPVEMEAGGIVANAGSILKMLMVVGSNPDEKKFLFRGNTRPLRDIKLLFEHDLGERGMNTLPSELSYLHER